MNKDRYKLKLSIAEIGYLQGLVIKDLYDLEKVLADADKHSDTYLSLCVNSLASAKKIIKKLDKVEANA